MEKINEENKMLALTLVADSDATLIHKETIPILPRILHTQNTKKTEGRKTQYTMTIEKQEMSILPNFLHIVTCYLTIIKTDHINTFIDFVKDKCNNIESMGLDGSFILCNIKHKMQKFLEFTKQYNDFVHQNLEWFQQRLFDIYVTCNPYSHKFVGAPKITTKFRPLCQIVTREAKINESRKDSGNNTISNIVIIQTGIVTYSHHCMTISCITKDGDRNDVHCPSPVTDFTRIAQDTVLATLPFKQMILIINSVSFIIKTLPLGFYKVSYVELSTFIGVEMFSKTIYLVDWVDNKIVSQFLAKEVPTDIAVGAGNKLLLSFPSISRVTCYNLAGLQLFEVETHYLNLVMQVTLYQNHFYVLQGHIIYRISTTGGVTMRDIGMKCRSVSVCRDAIFVTDDFGVPHMVTTNKDFWPRLSYNHQRCSPSLSNHFYIEDCYNITNILPMATSSTLIIYRNKKALVFTDTGEIISKNNLTFLEFPSVLCRINSNRFLVFYREMKGLQYITYPELTEGPLIKVHTNYITICHIVLNKFLALTTSGNKHEVHILLIKEDKVNVIERISLGHFNVTIAATPVNFVVVDGRENKLIFYLTSGEELFEKYLPFYGSSYFIYSDNIYFYVLFKRHSIVICYDIYGDIRWQWKLPFPVHPDIAVFQGTIYVLDTELNRVLLYKNHDRSSGCFLHLKNPYIRNLNIRLKEKGNVKLLIAEICHLSNGQLVVSDINHDCLLYISNEGDIVSRLSLPSTATDICRWNPNQIGVILPLEKQLRIIENLSETVRTVSLSQPYVRVCKLGKDKIACYSDKPSHLDILAIKNYNQVEIIHRINITFVVKSLAIENETQKLLIVTRGKAFQYNTSFGDGCHSSGDRLCSIKMVPRVLLSQVKCPPNFYAGSIDKTFVYLIDNSRMFAINDYNLMVNDLITNNQLNIYIDLVDVFSRNICVSEMLSSTLYLQDLTVSDKARHIPLSQSFGDEQPMRIHCLVITENNLIAGYDWQNKNIKIFTFDGQVLDSVKWNAFGFLKMCRWQSNTLVITDGDCIDNKYQLLTLKVEFPLSLVIYQTENRYDCITSLSNNQLVCSKWRDLYSVYVVEIDEIHSTLNEIKQIAIPETLSPRNELGNRNFITDIHDITVTAEDIIIVLNKRFIIFFNRDGQYLHSVRHYIKYVGHNDMMTVDDSLLYIQAAWDKCSSYFGYRSIVCLTQAGEYSGILLNKRIHRAKLSYPSINCKGPRFVGSYYPRNELYVQGLFIVNRESFSVARLQTDECPVEVKDFDISDEGKIVVCEKANNGNVKIFYESGELLCHRNIASLVGGVCFTEERDIMTTVSKTQEIFQLNRKDLEKFKVWQSQVPYGVIWRKVGNIYWCVHIELTECHCIKIDGDQVNILESVSLLNLDSGLHFSSITSQMNKEIFSNELINKLNYSAGFVRGGRSGKTGKKNCKSRLKVRCGNYIAESMLGIDEISVRQLPYRTAMVPLSIPTFDEPVNYNFIDIKDRNSKLIKLDNDVSVLMFRETLTLISATGDILQHKQLPQQQPHLDICRWKDEQFIVVFGKEMMVFNRNLCRLKTIKTEKYYNTIYKYNDNQIVCGGHYIGDITQNERNKNYEKEIYNNRFYYFCKDPDACDSYYVDVVDINDGEIKYEVCRGKTKVLGKLEGEAVVFDVGVTTFGDVIVVRRETKKMELGRWADLCFVEWYREKSLVRRIALEGKYYVGDNIHRPRLIAVGKNVYIRDRKNSIYQIPGHIEQETSEDSEDLTLKDIKKYSLLKQGDNEVFHVLGFDISENSFMVFGIIPGRQSFAFFFYDK